MTSIARLREKARKLEQREQWREALVVYQQIVAEGSDQELDVSLWNRMGDLHMRIGQTDQAVKAYEQAVTGYDQAGLHDTAVAVCRKILRAVPGHVEVHRSLGRISAHQGFMADARQSFLRYAAQMRQAGRSDAALDALREFADLAPDDLEVRRLIAEVDQDGAA
jgi:tetratricopeptide (TPR) repeat protein